MTEKVVCNDSSAVEGKADSGSQSDRRMMSSRPNENPSISAGSAHRADGGFSAPAGPDDRGDHH
jgi:hypothetical protein